MLSKQDEDRAMTLITGLLLALLPVCVYGTTSGSTNMYMFVPGKILPGPFTKGSVKVAKNLTLNECAAECSLEYLMNRFPCYAYEYAEHDKTCLMTNTTTLMTKGGYLGLRRNSAMDYYERPKGSYTNLFQPFTNQVLQQERSYFAVFKNKTLEKCAFFCLIETRKPCMSFSYSEKKKACGLSSVYYTANNGQTLRQSADYNHYQYYTTWPCNATIPWNYSPKAIASPYFPYASLKYVNCYLAIEAPEGKQVDLQFSTFYTNNSMCDSDYGIAVYDGRTSGAPFMSALCNSDNFVDRRYQSSSGYLYVHFSTGSIPMAFKATYDFMEVDLCKTAPCKNGGTCHLKSSTYICDCVAGYTGTQCETDIDECASNPCFLGGQCIDRVNAFECKCPDLLGGPRCNVFVGLCHLRPCQNGGHCSPRGTNRYVCTCPEQFTGTNCTEKIEDPCDKQPCKNGANCSSDLTQQSYTCQCLPGFTSNNCETNFDECSSNPCQHSFKCHDLVNDYRCECPPILGGKNCELFLGGCSTKPCEHGTCTPAGATKYTCQCEDGYKGVNCTERFIDFCIPNPCKHGQCSSSKQGPSCDCDHGYEGFFCDSKTNYCDGVKCNQGECSSLEDDFLCSCLPGYRGRFCNETTNHCETANCNGGFCINTLTSHFCVCRNGHTGESCDTPAMDLCSSTCVNGTCVIKGDEFHCLCSDDYTGDRCDTPINYCITEPCVHGLCESISGGYNCICDENYSGENCNDVIDYCVGNKCVYGFCLARDTGYDCLCGQGYHGNYCELKEGETSSSVARTTTIAMTTIETTAGNLRCSSETCRFGVCDQDFQNVCVCLLGYKGERCDIFAGCDVHDPCFHGNCSAKGNDFKCICEEGFSGDQCEVAMTDPDPCSSVTCHNGGICYSFNQSASRNGYQCICSPAYHGNNCEYINGCRNRDVCHNSTCLPIGNGVRCKMATLSGTSNFPTSSKIITGNLQSQSTKIIDLKSYFSFRVTIFQSFLLNIILNIVNAYFKSRASASPTSRIFPCSAL